MSMSKQLIKSSKDTDTNIYYTAHVINPPSSTKLLPAVFQEERNSPIINNPSEYNMAIIRFNIPSDSLPLFEFEENTYSVTLSYNGHDYQAYLTYVNIVPNSPYDNPIYYYNQFLDLMNTAFSVSFSTLKAANPGAPPTEAPYVIFNPSTQLFSFITQKSYDPVVAGSPTIDIYLNGASFTLFENITFESNFFNGPQPNGKDNKLVVKSFKNNYYPLNYDSTQNYYQFTSPFAFMRRWNEINSIQILSNSIPCRKELVGLPRFDSVSSFGTAVTIGGSVYSNLVTDFTPQINSNSDVLSVYYFYPQGPYRLIDLLDTNPLYKMDFSIYWTNQLGEKKLLYITPGTQIDVKFLFMKKTLNNYVNAGSV